MGLPGWRLVLLGVLGLAACATLPPERAGHGECRANYLGLDERAAAAGVRDGGAYRVPGFPYLRVDRFLASFRDELDEPARFDAWVERMRQLDLAAREAELRNLGWADPREELAHLDRCGRAWAARDLADPARRAELRERAAVPDDYSLLKRTLGVYPVAAPFLNWGIRRFNRDVMADYATPYAELSAPGELVLWTGSRVGFRTLDVPPDALGLLPMDAPEWHRLAEQHQPAWLIETAGDFDRPGAVTLGRDAPGVDSSQPVTYFLPAYTRFGETILRQLVYFVWFSERPRTGWLDSYAGALDAVVWRVTLDAEGAPLLYDTIHACGCYHYYFLAQPLERRERAGLWEEPVLFPQQAPAEPFAVRLQSGTHYVRRLVPLDDLDVAPRDYALRPYDELLTLPDAGGGTRSLFDEDGLVRGTERFERFWLWPAGIESVGAMRQWGRHPTSLVGRSHFDDPAVMDRLLNRPQSAQSGQSR